MRALVALGCVVAVAGCTLRPRYADFVTKQTKAPGTVTVELVKPPDNTPLAGVKLEMGEGKARFSATTDEQGRVKLPVDLKQVDENPIIVVNPPPGLTKWKLRQVFEPDPVPTPEVAPAPTPAP
ncbi:MAG: hypothetical protein K1X89_19500 [Myxococcaceae bacterium]|nr:hypothetical protein [Myxococcaceae bacterium]